jgi:hypothetical protein
MGALIVNGEGRPIVRSDGALRAQCAPAGFLKVTRNAINRFMLAYPHLMYVDEGVMTVDLFNHGAHKGVWYGEDYAFCRNWTDLGDKVWIIPDLDITHWLGDVPYVGNFHQFLLRCDGGSESDHPCSPAIQN